MRLAFHFVVLVGILVGVQQLLNVNDEMIRLIIGTCSFIFCIITACSLVFGTKEN